MSPFCQFDEVALFPFWRDLLLHPDQANEWVEHLHAGIACLHRLCRDVEWSCRHAVSELTALLDSLADLLCIRSLSAGWILVVYVKLVCSVDPAICSSALPHPVFSFLPSLSFTGLSDLLNFPDKFLMMAFRSRSFPDAMLLLSVPPCSYACLLMFLITFLFTTGPWLYRLMCDCCWLLPSSDSISRPSSIFLLRSLRFGCVSCYPALIGGLATLPASLFATSRRWFLPTTIFEKPGTWLRGWLELFQLGWAFQECGFVTLTLIGPFCPVSLQHGIQLGNKDIMTRRNDSTSFVAYTFLTTYGPLWLKTEQRLALPHPRFERTPVCRSS